MKGYGAEMVQGVWKCFGIEMVQVWMKIECLSVKELRGSHHPVDKSKVT
jgi:hypothetical protein